MKATDSGFTLIEMMIVVAILGILAGVSVMKYQEYVVRTQVNRVVCELAGYKSAVEVNINQGRSLTNSEIGFTPSNLTTASLGGDVANFNADGSGSLQVVIGRDAHTVMHGLIIQHVRSVSGEWRCQLDTSAVVSNWDPSYLPDSCLAP